jgi:DNA topoisomerase I
MKNNSIGVDCPECSAGSLVELVSKKGLVFYGCTQFPKCQFVSWAKPVDHACPECGSIYLVEKRLRSTVRLHCPNEGCGFRKPVRSAAPTRTEDRKAG